MSVYVSSSVDGELVRYVVSCLSFDQPAKAVVSVSEERYRAWSSGGGFLKPGLRLWMYVVHPLRMCFCLLRSPRGAVWVVTTNPFYAPALAVMVARLRGHRVIQLLYDLYPDALEVAGIIRRDGIWSRWIGSSTRFALRNASQTVFLGEQLRLHTENRWGAAKRASLIPVICSRAIPELPEQKEGGAVSIHYGGQLGHMHDAVRLAECLRFACNTMSVDERSGFTWSFRIGGACAERFQQDLAELELEVGPTLPPRQWREVAQSSQVGLVSLSSEGAKVCLPNKAYGMMACGLAILGFCPRESDLGQLILREQIGWVVDTGEKISASAVEAAFLSVLREIRDTPEILKERRQNALCYIREQNALDQTGSRWRDLIEKEVSR